MEAEKFVRDYIMMQFFSTRQVAQIILKVKPDTLQKAIWQGRVKPPSKGPSGQYLWTIRDIESASWALHCYESFAQWQETISKDVSKNESNA